jgi:HTH-type transcriptional regulator / antitoxin MqsA
MKKCTVCGNASFSKQNVEQVFNIDGRMLLVQDMPAEVCERCGEATFSRKTVEHVRRLIHGEARPKKRVRLDVFAYAG